MSVDQQFEDQAFLRAGIGKTYLRKTLTKMLPYSLPALDYVRRPEFAAELKEEGRGVVLAGEAPQAWEVLHLIAKSAMVRSVTCRMMNLSQLISYVTDDDVAPIEAPALFVYRFSDTHWQENPYSPAQVSAIEDFIFRHVEEGGSFSVSVPENWHGAWWSGSLYGFLRNRNGRVDL